MKWIKDLIRRNPHITLNEIWYKLKINKGYTRRPASLYRILRQIGYYNNPEVKGTSKKHNKEYNTPKQIEEKWQIDVKYVPMECKVKLPGDKRYYQWNDNERFYSWLRFYSLEDLRKQGAAYLKRSNKIPMAVLGYLTPKEKRAELIYA